MSGHHAEAGNLLASELDLNPSDVEHFDAEHRRLAYLAATYFEKGGQRDTAAALFEALGEHDRATKLRIAKHHQQPSPKQQDCSSEVTEPPSARPMSPVTLPPLAPQGQLVSMPDHETSSEMTGSSDPTRPTIWGRDAGTSTPDLVAALDWLHTATHRRSTLTFSHEQHQGSEPGPFDIGNLIANRFRLEALIGSGGMATVFRASDLELTEEVAIKVFAQRLSDLPGAEESLQRFRQELKLCRRLHHPNIIQLYDIGVHCDRRYLTMELLKGNSLSELLGQPIDTALGLSFLIQACDGLAAAHERGVIHRDIKPENLFVTEDGTVKVMDFGIAKSTYAPGVTIAGTIAGTPEYISPEQISDFSSVTGAADQYSLGVVAYEMFAGVLPFVHEQLPSLFWMHMQDEPKPPRSLNPALPEEVEQVVLQLLAKKPEDRFASCGAVSDRCSELLERILRRSGPAQE